MDKPIWSPSQSRIEQSGIHRFCKYVESKYEVSFDSYKQFHQWSVENNEQFWPALWDFCQVIGDQGDRIVSHKKQMEKSEWFPDATLNFAENLLRRKGADPAIISRTGSLPRSELSWDELSDQVSIVAQYLRDAGIKKGDRVAAIMTNCPEAVVAMLATASLGAIWTSVSPDFGEEGIVERFSQSEPAILFSINEYRYGGKRFEISKKIESVVKQIESIKQMVLVCHYQEEMDRTPIGKHCDFWDEVLARYAPSDIAFEPVGFNHPLYILYSSGTTGKPKCIAHRTGGVLLQHLKELHLHSDINSGDRVFFFTTCGWMMWNWLVSALALGATLMLYDESPFYPEKDVLLEYADKEKANLFGVSASYLRQLEKLGISPKQKFNLDALKFICSTGSVLAPEGFDYVYAEIKEDVCLASISGGTDIISCFALGNPALPVYRGESQCIGLAMDVQVWDWQGNRLLNDRGELVCCSSFPSQPWGFWGDKAGERYHNAYFSRFENIWHHGDYVSQSEHGGITFYGRSDTTLNPSGVRIGTAEIYRYVESIPAVLESAAVGQNIDNNEHIVLFVKLAEGVNLNEKLTSEIKAGLRSQCSPRHVPARVVQVTDIPKTKSGKVVELAIKQIIHGRSVENIEALANPESLDQYVIWSDLNLGDNSNSDKA